MDFGWSVFDIPSFSLSLSKERPRLFEFSLHDFKTNAASCMKSIHISKRVVISKHDLIALLVSTRPAEKALRSRLDNTIFDLQ